MKNSLHDHDGKWSFARVALAVWLCSLMIMFWWVFIGIGYKEWDWLSFSGFFRELGLVFGGLVVNYMANVFGTKNGNGGQG